MKVPLAIICLMFLIGCSGTVKEATPQPQLFSKTKYLPTHQVTSQDFVFKDGKICTINSLADVYCSSPSKDISFDIETKQFAKKDFTSPVSFDKENFKRKVKYLVNLEDKDSLEYSFGRDSFTITAKHKF